MKIQDPSIMAIPSSLRTILWAKTGICIYFKKSALLKSKGAYESRRGLMESFRHGGA
jgi:hypothetical protein